MVFLLLGNYFHDTARDSHERKSICEEAEMICRKLGLNRRKAKIICSKVKIICREPGKRCGDQESEGAGKALKCAVNALQFYGIILKSRETVVISSVDILKILGIKLKCQEVAVVSSGNILQSGWSARIDEGIVREF